LRSPKRPFAAKRNFVFAPPSPLDLMKGTKLLKEDIRNVYKILVREAQAKSPLWTHRSRQKDKTKVDFREIMCAYVDRT
jgi:hypothetical protein